MSAAQLMQTDRIMPPSFSRRRWDSPEQDLAHLLAGYESLSLAELEETRARLLNRVESKHLMTMAQCRDLLEEIFGSYRALEVQRSRIGRYETMYYDNAAFLTYCQHHNGKGNRYKLRYRRYGSSGETYLEVKKKTNKGATEKRRMKTCWPSSGFLPEEEAFLEEAFPYDWQEFHPVLTTEYDRITLVSNDSPERITFDTGVSFGNGQWSLTYPNLVIGEIKYERGVKQSPALRAIHAMGIRKRSFSKYCMGVMLLYDLKHNRFKENQLFLQRNFSGGCVSC